MFLSLPILSIVALNLMLAQQVCTAFAWSEKKCNECNILLTEVKKVLESVTEISGEKLEQIIQEQCDKHSHHHVLEEICDYFGEKIISDLLNWIEEEEGKIDVEEGCERIRLCPHGHH